MKNEPIPIEERLEKLERKNLRMKLSGLGVLVIVGAVVLMGQARPSSGAPVPGPVVATDFTLFLASPLKSQTDTAPDDLAKSFNWGEITSTKTGIQLSLRTRWENGVLKYVATLTDSKGRVARYFSKHPDNGQIPMSSFQVTFLDEEGFHLYTLDIRDRTFSKVEGTVNFESAGESECTEQIYRAAVKASKASSTNGQSAYELTFPTELGAAPVPVKH